MCAGCVSQSWDSAVPGGDTVWPVLALLELNVGTLHGHPWSYSKEGALVGHGCPSTELGLQLSKRHNPANVNASRRCCVAGKRKKLLPEPTSKVKVSASIGWTATYVSLKEQIFPFFCLLLSCLPPYVADSQLSEKCNFLMESPGVTT